MDKSELLDRLGSQGEERLLLAHVLDRAEQARRRNGPAERPDPHGLPLPGGAGAVRRGAAPGRIFGNGLGRRRRL